MRAIILGMLAETSIHPGSGQDAGFIDLPVAREVATDYPVIVGSSLKGALKDKARTAKLNDLDRLFGKQEDAGQLLVGDARLLLLPVRSLHGSYKWVTCPQLLQRYQRDRARASNRLADYSDIKVMEGECLANCTGELFLEERQFTVEKPTGEPIQELIAPLIPSLASHLKERLVILHDDDFAWFARYGLAVNARNQLDIEKKTSKYLWYEETIPPDAVFYCLLAERESSGALDSVLTMFEKVPYLQVGGNETVGQGWFAIKPLDDSNVVGGAAL